MRRLNKLSVEQLLADCVAIMQEFEVIGPGNGWPTEKSHGDC